MQSSWHVSPMPFFLTVPHRPPPRAATCTCAHASLQILGCPNLRPTLHQHHQLRSPWLWAPCRVGGGTGLGGHREASPWLREVGLARTTREPLSKASPWAYMEGRLASPLSSLTLSSPKGATSRTAQEGSHPESAWSHGRREGAGLPSEEPPQGSRRTAVKALTGCCPASNRP